VNADSVDLNWFDTIADQWPGNSVQHDPKAACQGSLAFSPRTPVANSGGSALARSLGMGFCEGTMRRSIKHPTDARAQPSGASTIAAASPTATAVPPGLFVTKRRTGAMEAFTVTQVRLPAMGSSIATPTRSSISRTARGMASVSRTRRVATSGIRLGPRARR
jgi:hypothetical protein